jgi:septal ring factor EnvC (AmiA/AmiB activator)
MMTRPKLVAAATLFCALALASGVSRAEIGQRSGIGVDVEMARVLDGIESDGEKQTRLREELDSLTKRRAQTGTALKSRVRALYRITRAGMAPVAGGLDAVRGHVARVKRLTNLVKSDSAQLRTLEARAKLVRAESSLVEASLTRSRERLTALQDQGLTASAGDDFMQMVASNPQGVAIQEPNGAFYGIRIVDDEPTGTFVTQRGTLATPVSGEVRVVDARRAESDGPGLEFQARAGTAVRGAAAGRVAFSDRYGSYGKLVILDHGDGYYTAYGGLGGIEVRVGDDLSARARLGSIGGDVDEPALFFEVRKGTRTLPPREWLGL